MKTNSNYLAYATVLLTLCILTGCSSINQTTAEQSAIAFLKKNVKFFAQEQDQLNRTIVPNYNYDIISSKKEGRNWDVVVYVSAQLENDTKENTVKVTVGKNAKVILFNGQKVPDY